MKHCVSILLAMPLCMASAVGFAAEEAEAAPYAFSTNENGQTVLTVTADDGVISGLAGCGGFRRRDRNPLCGRTGCDQRESLRPLCARRGRRAVRSAGPVRAGGLRGGINRNEMAAAAVLNGLVPPFDCIGKAIG